MAGAMQNPGSAAAIAAGCLCDFIKNEFGRGCSEKDGVAFYCEERCPVHGVLMAFSNPGEDTSFASKSDIAKAAIEWLKTRIARPTKRGL